MAENTQTKKARFQQLSNDLFWEVFDGEKFIKWQGYNDAYWWDNVAKSDTFQVRGNFRLDPETDIVTITAPSVTL